MLYITTSSGVLRYDPESDELRVLIPMEDRQWTGFFGIVWHQNSHGILTACRQRLGKKRVRKHSTDVILHRIDPRSEAAEEIAVIHDVHDVHQIAVWEDTLFLTDTGLNRLHRFDLSTGSTTAILPVGPERDDVHHLNALLVHEDHLLVGLNNRGHRDAEILRIPLSELTCDLEDVDALSLGSVIPVTGFAHTHDLEPFDGGLICCASHDGLIVRVKIPEVLINVGGWTRGLAADRGYLWVGISQFAKRSIRHTESVDGELRQLDVQSRECVRSIPLMGAGQVHDLLMHTAD
ncbi:hypothetical protein ACFL6T_04325 [Candidatus Zixiibacteriota bacterium]